MKPLRILDDVAERDLPGIVSYHLPQSRAKAEAIVAEYDRFIEQLRRTPAIFRERPHGWRVCVFRSGSYSLYFRELGSCWLVAGVFHARRDPDWIQARLLIREVRDRKD
ncbi:MAG: type II toxin-antitoxin system RelE/ParE family toxin [Verrucomicrobia bacterium]|nr:type II toxin-antitoxin system RelE/ParE family toxin [Verrucomicrobiota bacterium]